MDEMFVKDIPFELNIKNTQLNYAMIKELVNALYGNGLLTYKKQKAIFDKEIFLNIWSSYESFLKIFDPNYNSLSDFRKFFSFLIKGIYKKEKLNFFALFCPGYTKYGYKDYLGGTTKWKLKRLYDLKNMLDAYGIKNNIQSYYSDAFLENTSIEKEPYWKSQMELNRQLFHNEGEKYFPKENINNITDIEIFQGEKAVSGYVLNEEINRVNPKTYDSFKKNNQKFYTKLGFTNEEMQMRNDRLITMYRILSNYLNSLDNMIFLPMENMYERENIFSENGTCTMYLILEEV